jgi:hypothetical protein
VAVTPPADTRNAAIATVSTIAAPMRRSFVPPSASTLVPRTYPIVKCIVSQAATPMESAMRKRR